jgi:hypothetical protein
MVLFMFVVSVSSVNSIGLTQQITLVQRTKWRIAKTIGAEVVSEHKPVFRTYLSIFLLPVWALILLKSSRSSGWDRVVESEVPKFGGESATRQ